MKIIAITLRIVTILPLAACQGFANQGLLGDAIGQSIQEAVAPRYVTSLGSLNPTSPKKRWKKFFKERGVQGFWQQLQRPTDSLVFCFVYPRFEEVGLADEVAAGIIRYLAYQHQKVKSLKLIGNKQVPHQQLTHLPVAIGQLTSLQYLSLWGNQLQEIPSAMGQLRSLKVLDLRNNQLQQIPIEITQLKSLQALNLSCNQLQELPAWIGQLKSLRDCYLWYNQLSGLSEKLYVPIKDERLWLHLEGNPLLQEKWLDALPVDSLACYAYQELPRSLHTLCAHHIYQQADLSEQQRKVIYQALPEELKEAVQLDSIHQECQWPQKVQIVFFYKNIPFYLDRQLCTPQNVKAMLEELKDRQLYLVPQDKQQDQQAH